MPKTASKSTATTAKKSVGKASGSKRTTTASNQARQKRTPRTRKPPEMSIEEWQRALRREFGRDQDFQLKNIGDHPIFSDFQVTNPASGGSYRVAIRGRNPGANYCSCPDFAVNTLGTCKHIEYTLARLERKRGAKKAFQEGFHPPYSEIYLEYGAQRAVHFRPGAQCPDSLRRYAGRFFDEDGYLRDEAYEQFHTFLHTATSGEAASAEDHELRCYPEVLEFVARIRDDANRRKGIRKAFPKGADSPAFKKLLKRGLYPYQRTGALFAATVGRAVLADDMGLGKTVQAIAAGEILARHAGVERVLVVTPSAVKHQWREEIERFTDRTVEVLEGLWHDRRAAYARESFYKIVNYDVIPRDVDLIAGWEPDLIILDEAQRIKNWKTRRAQAVKQLQSDYAIVLTGTPLENRLEELHSIVEFVDRFHLGPLFRFLHEHQHVDKHGRVVGYKNLSQLAKTLEPMLLRRTKTEVLKELPERVDKHVFVEMTSEQAIIHEENRTIVAKLVNKWKRLGFLTEAEQRKLMIALQYMRMACDSTYLIDKTTDHGVKADELAALLEDILEEEDIKVVVFSQWLGMHQLIIQRLDERNWDHAFYHGSLDGRRRKECLERFRNDPNCRILLCTDSGGIGLNLQHASVVVNMDQPWNPAVLEQRIGRVYRIGQNRHIRVVHFVAENTIEHSMLSVLKFKKSMFAGVLDGGENEVFLGGTRLKQFMDTVDNVAQKIPEGAPRPSEGGPGLDDAAEESEVASGSAEQAASSGGAPAASQAEVLQQFVTAGMQFLEGLQKSLEQPRKSEQNPGGAQGVPAQRGIGVEQDERTGEAYIKVPMPEPETMQQISSLVQAFAQSFLQQSKGGRQP